MRAIRRADPDDHGLGLIELIVAILVSTIVLAGIAAVLVNSWLTQNDVLSTGEATNRGQLVSAAIERAVRNATDFKTEDGDTELWVHTVYDDPKDTDPRTCQAFDLGYGKAQMKRAATDLGAATWGAWVDDSQQSWVVNVAQIDGVPMFQKNGQVLTYAFEIATDSAPVRFQGEVSMRITGTGGAPCWP
jgi:Tfp pilus assembly protein PilW